MNEENKYYEDTFFDLSDIIQSILRKKYLIVFITLVFSIASIFYSLSLPNIYESNTKLKLTEDSSPSSALSNITSQFGGLANLVGVSVPGGQGSTKANYAIELMKSKEFTKHINSFPGITEKLIATKSIDKTTGKIVYDSELFDSEKKQWVRAAPAGRNVVPSYLEVHKEVLKNLDITLSKKTGFISISFKHESPVFAYEFINLITSEINKITKKQDLAESESSLNYLYSQLQKVSEKDIRDSINKLIEVQLNTNMLANLKEDYLLGPIDPSFIPEVKSGPRRSIICIVGTLLGFMLSIMYVLTTYLFYSKKNSDF
tara:strand:+ start:198 stop:1145 length:948 start_codon:yes stop_codon:yes gene_type:complete